MTKSHLLLIVYPFLSSTASPVYLCKVALTAVWPVLAQGKCPLKLRVTTQVVSVVSVVCGVPR